MLGHGRAETEGRRSVWVDFWATDRAQARHQFRDSSQGVASYEPPTMQDVAATFVDGDVVDRVAEEEKVTWFEGLFIEFDGVPDLRLLPSVAGQADTRVPPHQLGQARTIQSRRTSPAPAIWSAEQHASRAQGFPR